MYEVFWWEVIRRAKPWEVIFINWISYLLVASSKIRIILRCKRALDSENNCVCPGESKSDFISAVNPPLSRMMSQRCTVSRASMISVSEQLHSTSRFARISPGIMYRSWGTHISRDRIWCLGKWARSAPSMEINPSVKSIILKSTLSRELFPLWCKKCSC